MARVTVETDRRIAEIIKAFYNDRVGFVKHVIGATPKPNQADLLAAHDRNDYVCVKSGVGTGKSTSESWLILHYMSCRPECKIICTSPSKEQLFNVLWAELNMWHKRMNPLFRDLFVWTKTQFTHREHEHWFAVARTATKENPQSLAGIHARYVLRIIDEGSAVMDAAWDVLEGDTGTVETKELTCGNPTALSGYFYDAFNKNSASYKLLTWNSEQLLESKGGLVPDRIVERIRRKYGEDSNMYRIRVRGAFPLKDGDSFIPFDVAYEATFREVPPQKDYDIVFGCDIARYGDDSTVIAIRQGDEFQPFHELRNKSTMETGNYIALLAKRLKPKVIFVDVIGLGAGVFDYLEMLGYPVFPVNVAETPALNGALYKRLRDELWGLMRDWLEARRGRLRDNEDGDLLAELTTPRYKVVAGGKIQIESKNDMKKRGKSSPNIADAHIMTFAQPMAEYRKESGEGGAYYSGEAEANMFVLDAEAGY